MKADSPCLLRQEQETKKAAEGGGKKGKRRKGESEKPFKREKEKDNKLANVNNPIGGTPSSAVADADRFFACICVMWLMRFVFKISSRWYAAMLIKPPDMHTRGIPCLRCSNSKMLPTASADCGLLYGKGDVDVRFHFHLQPRIHFVAVYDCLHCLSHRTAEGHAMSGSHITKVVPASADTNKHARTGMHEKACTKRHARKAMLQSS